MDGATADSDGTVWTVTEIDGWEAAESELNTISLTARPGLGLASNTYAGRPIVVNGFATATSNSNRWKASSKLAALVGLVTAVDMKVYETVTLTAKVITGGRPNIRPVSYSSIEWQLSLVALNPFKLGVSHTETFTAGQTKTLTNAGTFTAYPIWTTSGSGVVSITNTTTSQTLTASTVPSGTAFDTYARTAYTGTTNRYAALASGINWPTLAPGANSVTNNGAASLSVTFLDTYL